METFGLLDLLAVVCVVGTSISVISNLMRHHYTWRKLMQEEYLKDAQRAIKFIEPVSKTVEPKQIKPETNRPAVYECDIDYEPYKDYVAYSWR